MAKQAHEILADALEAAANVAIDNVVQSRQMKEKQVTLLKKEGFLKPIIRGWYLLDADLVNADTGTSVLWHESYWSFIGQYLREYLGDAYCVSAEQSLDLHTGSSEPCMKRFNIENFMAVKNLGSVMFRFNGNVHQFPEVLDSLTTPLKNLGWFSVSALWHPRHSQ